MHHYREHVDAIMRTDSTCSRWPLAAFALPVLADGEPDRWLSPRSEDPDRVEEPEPPLAAPAPLLDDPVRVESGREEEPLASD